MRKTRNSLSIGSLLSYRRDPSLFHIWLQWLRELGGQFEVYRDLSERKPPTGRRDPDRKPRSYKLDNKKYGMDPNTGTIWRRAVTI